MHAMRPVYVARRAKAVTAAMAVVAAIALAATGCGRIAGSFADGGTNGLEVQTPDQVVSDAVTALRAAPSVQMVISPQPSVGPFKEAKAQIQGDVTIITFVRNSQALFEIAFVGGKEAYIQFSHRMLQQEHMPSLLKRLAAGHWLKMPQLPHRMPSRSLLVMASSLEHHGPLLPIVQQTTLNGRKVVVVTDWKNGSKLYVANTGRAYPLLITGSPGQVALTDYGASFDVPTPANTLPDGTTYTGPALV